VLPDVARKEGLDDTMDELFGKDDSFDVLVGGDELTHRLVELQLPRFEVSYGIKLLAETLRTLGMGAVFQRGAEFGRMAPGAFPAQGCHEDGRVGDCGSSRNGGLRDQGYLQASPASACEGQGGSPIPVCGVRQATKHRPVCGQSRDWVACCCCCRGFGFAFDANFAFCPG